MKKPKQSHWAPVIASEAKQSHSTLNDEIASVATLPRNDELSLTPRNDELDGDLMRLLRFARNDRNSHNDENFYAGLPAAASLGFGRKK